MIAEVKPKSLNVLQLFHLCFFVLKKEKQKSWPKVFSGEKKKGKEKNNLLVAKNNILNIEMSFR